jgi:hypothetical protein
VTADISPYFGKQQPAGIRALAVGVRLHAGLGAKGPGLAGVGSPPEILESFRSNSSFRWDLGGDLEVLG